MLNSHYASGGLGQPHFRTLKRDINETVQPVSVKLLCWSRLQDKLPHSARLIYRYEDRCLINTSGQFNSTVAHHHWHEIFLVPFIYIRWKPPNVEREISFLPWLLFLARIILYFFALFTRKFHIAPINRNLLRFIFIFCFYTAFYRPHQLLLLHPAQLQQPLPRPTLPLPPYILLPSFCSLWNNDSIAQPHTNVNTKCQVATT